MYTDFKVFGCCCYPFIRPYQKHKFSYHTETCIFIRYSLAHKGYKCRLSSSGKVYIVRQAKFNETDFPFKNEFNCFLFQDIDSAGSCETSLEDKFTS